LLPAANLTTGQRSAIALSHEAAGLTKKEITVFLLVGCRLGMQTIANNYFSPNTGLQHGCVQGTCSEAMLPWKE